ncbi:hypothetical protein K7G98_18755 [Saccharothrix sp. MB29]|nr:hypothetical protein [Saccharothrix sp. MB29]
MIVNVAGSAPNCPRSRARQEDVAAAASAGGSCGTTYRASPLTSPSGSVRATAAHSRTVGWAASAASRSVSSIRLPSSLTWKSRRPRNSSRPSHRKRPRSPVR